MVLTGDDFPQVSPVKPAETPWLSVLGVSGAREGDPTGVYWVQARGDARHPSVPRTALQQQNLAPDVSDAEVERPWSQVRLQFWGRQVVLRETVLLYPGERVILKEKAGYGGEWCRSRG